MRERWGSFAVSAPPPLDTAAQEKFGTFLRKPWRPSAKAWRVRAPPMPAGDKSAYEQALADVQRAISP
jgi:hypothetical protein